MQIYETERLILRRLEAEESNLLLDYLLRNRDFFRKWEPRFEDGYYTDESMRDLISRRNEALENKTGLDLYVFNKGENRVIGKVVLSSIVYGVFLSCFLGYKLDEAEINKGKMTEALQRLIGIAFGEYGLHRLEANIMPGNVRSVRVVEKLGFVNEGMSRRYLKINDAWEDHLHFVLLNRAVE